MRPIRIRHITFARPIISLLAVVFMAFRMDAAFADHSSLNIGIPLLEPYATKLENGTLSGVYPEISREIAKRAGLKIKLEASPLARMWLQFSGGQYDIMYALPNEEHGRHGRHLADLFNLQIIAVARKDIRVCRISDLKNNVVGTLRRVAYRPRQDQVPAENLRSANSYDQLVRMLSVARIDAIIGTDLSIIHLFKKYELTPDELSAPFLLKTVPVYVYGNRQSSHQEKIDRFAVKARELIREGGVGRAILARVPQYAYASRPTNCPDN